jgi:hypothetical protein
MGSNSKSNRSNNTSLTPIGEYPRAHQLPSSTRSRPFPSSIILPNSRVSIVNFLPYSHNFSSIIYPCTASRKLSVEAVQFPQSPAVLILVINTSKGLPTLGRRTGQWRRIDIQGLELVFEN